MSEMTEADLKEQPGNKIPSYMVIDGFYQDPDAIREMALKAEYAVDYKFYKGSRSVQQFRFPFLRERLEQILNIKMLNWGLPTNGKFQYGTYADPRVFHSDQNRWAGVVYLTPQAPWDAGTSFFVRKDNVLTYDEDHLHMDATAWTEVDRVANMYNRLVLWNGRAAHGVTNYFGDKLENCRLTQVFFFD